MGAFFDPLGPVSAVCCQKTAVWKEAVWFALIEGWCSAGVRLGVPPPPWVKDMWLGYQEKWEIGQSLRCKGVASFRERQKACKNVASDCHFLSSSSSCAHPVMEHGTFPSPVMTQQARSSPHKK